MIRKPGKQICIGRVRRKIDPATTGTTVIYASCMTSGLARNVPCSQRAGYSPGDQEGNGRPKLKGSAPKVEIYVRISTSATFFIFLTMSLTGLTLNLLDISSRLMFSWSSLTFR